MPAKPFHLGWFQTFQANEWKTPYTLSEGVPFTGDFYVELAQALERACFDFLMLEDTVGIPRGLEGTEEPPVACLGSPPTSSKRLRCPRPPPSAPCCAR